MNEKLKRYTDLLKAYNEHTNIYSKTAYNKLDFHITDSITLAGIIGNTNLTVIDLGSGSGLPSIPIAIMNPNNTVYAIESKSRKTRFLDQAKTELNLANLHIINKNIPEFTPLKPAEIITAKAFASPEKIIQISKQLRNSKTSIYIPISASQKKSYEQKPQITIVSHETFLYAKLNIKPIKKI